MTKDILQFFKNLFYHLYIHPVFFYAGIGVVIVFVVSFFIPSLFLPSQILLLILLLFFIFDIGLLFLPISRVDAERIVGHRFSNGDQNKVDLYIYNKYSFDIQADIIDELPPEFQVRDFEIKKTILAGDKVHLPYLLRPTFRGLVGFGDIHIYVTSPLRMIKRRYSIKAAKEVAVYPSVVDLRKYELMAFSNKIFQHGLKKVRKLGHTMEFEKIKEYVPGDDFRTVNWKATAKSNKLMVNQFQDERSQSVYCIVDKGRVMKMPFDGLSLLDYAINTCIILSNVVLRKQDYAGFFSFSKRVDNRVAADKRATQKERIMEALYNVKTDFFESDYGRLYADIKKNITHRSLLFLFTNFETLDGLTRQLPYLKAISKNHLLIVIFFQNTELEHLAEAPADTDVKLYDKVIAEKFIFEKKLIVQELKKYGIMCILTKPQNLTVDALNKYLEIKARNMI
ncbi:MAG: DUF58 domain-containing protein [Saprospiraceae bacterium]|nr:DUF58 domain-containing protein [Saprospiraceae bacterium]